MIDLQPALIGISSEFFRIGNVTRMVSMGSVEIIETLPDDFYNLLKTALEKDKSAQIGLDKLEISLESDRIEKYFNCNFSAYDQSPDITETGSLGNREVVDCSERGLCCAENLLCRYPKGLTIKQFQVAKRIAQGEMDAEICYELDITQNTLRKHKNSIEEKIGMSGKVAIGVWASRNKII